jgi:hypothetical protein
MGSIAVMGLPGASELILLLFLLLPACIWIWALIDCANNEPSSGNDKIIWVLIIIFLGVFGALLYLIARRPKRVRQYGK